MKTKSYVDFTGFSKKDIAVLKQAALAVLKSEKIKKYQINFIMVSDQEIKKLNTKFRKVRRITDVISFLVVPEMFIGDIYIAKGRSQKQAKKYANTWQELVYLVIHGVLSVGYTD